MGNGTNKEKTTTSPLKSFVPPNRNPKSQILNQMMMKAVRKIEEDNFLSDADDKFSPKTIYFDDMNSTRETKQNPYDYTQKMYNLPDKQNNNSNGQSKSRNEQQRSDQQSYNSVDISNSSQGHLKKGSTIGLYGELNAPRNSDKGTRYFLSNNKLSSLQSVKGINKGVGFQSAGNQKPVTLKLNEEQISNFDPKDKIKSVLSPSNVLDDEEEGANIGENLEKKSNSSKKRLVIDCNLEKKIFCLPESVLFLLLTYLLNDYPKLIQVSSVWYYKINEIFDDHMVTIDNSFIKKYMNILAFQRSYFSVMPYKLSNKRALRMDRNILAEVLPLSCGYSISFGFSYELINKRGKTFKATYKFDVVKRGNRTIWIYKEESRHNYDEKTAFIQPIIPVCVGDSIKFAINFYNYSGLIDLNSIQWKDPILENVPTIPNEISSNFLDGINKNRICEVEEIYNDWVLYKYFENRRKMEYDFFQPQLTLKETRCAGGDNISIKSQYIATCPGDVVKALQKLGVNIVVYPSYEDVIVEVKRTGLYQDLENFLQLRVGDNFMFYLTRGD